MQFDFTQNHFALFGLPAQFSLDERQLADRWRQLQAQVHPDRFASQPDAERRLALQWATRLNEAYQTLKDPVARGRYLLSLHGVDTQEETNTAMPMEFLMQQMEWREAIEEAQAGRDVAALDRLLATLRAEMTAGAQALAACLDVEKNWPAAAEQVRKLRFLERLRHEISTAIEALEG